MATIDDEYIEAIFSSSPLHDIGKVGIPDEVLLKPGKLTAKEFEVMQLHSTIGGEVLLGAGRTLSAKNWLTMARTIALEHHEKFDGTGYPRGIKGEEIDLAARITALADAYDAITSKRVYKPALPHEEARRRILESSGTHFDPEVVAAFIACEPEFIRIRDEHNEGTETRQFIAVGAVGADTAMFRRIEQLIDTSAGRRS
jgi:putative two-component system response regulator